jgi:hypothetical protein
MRAHDVSGKRISVGVLYAHSVRAKTASIVVSGAPLPDKELEAQAGRQDVDAQELVVDVLYAHDVKAMQLSVRELHASDVRVGRGEDSGD